MVRLIALFLVWLCAAPVAAQQTDFRSDNAARFRGKDGRRVTVVCPPNTQHGTVWGSDVYTDDSSVCGAAMHAGIINASEGGAVTAVITGGRASYAGSERNGVTTRSFGEYPGSFTVEKGDGGEIDWTTKAAGVEATKGPLAVVCPATESAPSATIWGSDIYSDDSPVCVAAVHAGVITPGKGGRVVIQAAPGLSSYRGTNRNGVASREYGKWRGSFRFEGVVAEAETPALPARAQAGPVAPTGTVARSGPVNVATQAPVGPTSAAANARGNQRLATGQRPSGERAVGAAPNDPPAVHATGFTAYAGYGRIVLSWKPVAGAHGYRLARSSWDATKLAWIPGSEVEFPKDRPAPEDVVYTQKWVEIITQDANNQPLIFWELESESTRTVPSGTVQAGTSEEPRVGTYANLIRPATRWITTVSPRGAIADTTFTDASVTPGTQYVYWLDTWFKSADGTFYSPTSGPYPTVTANPRDPSGMSWLPPAIERDSALRLKRVVPGPAGVLVEWEPKRLVAGYVVMRTIIDTTHYRRYLGKNSKCYPFVRSSFSTATSVQFPMTPKQDNTFCLGIFAIYPDQIANGTPVTSAQSVNMNAWKYHHEVLENSVHSKGLFISAEWDSREGRWRVLEQGTFPIDPCMTGGYSTSGNNCVRSDQ